MHDKRAPGWMWCLLLPAAAPGCGAPPAPEPPVVVVRSGPQVIAREMPPSPPGVTCPPSCIPDTEVPDTVENRAVIAFCERYRDALVAKDASALLSLASPRYHDDGGTPDPADDLDYAGLQGFLRQRFAGVEDIAYTIRYARIVRKGATIRVEVALDGTFKLAGAAQATRHHDENTLVLEAAGKGFRILSGM